MKKAQINKYYLEIQQTMKQINMDMNWPVI